MSRARPPWEKYGDDDGGRGISLFKQVKGRYSKVIKDFVVTPKELTDKESVYQESTIDRSDDPWNGYESNDLCRYEGLSNELLYHDNDICKCRMYVGHTRMDMVFENSLSGRDIAPKYRSRERRSIFLTFHDLNSFVLREIIMQMPWIHGTRCLVSGNYRRISEGGEIEYEEHLYYVLLLKTHAVFIKIGYRELEARLQVKLLPYVQSEEDPRLWMYGRERSASEIFVEDALRSYMQGDEVKTLKWVEIDWKTGGKKVAAFMQGTSGAPRNDSILKDVDPDVAAAIGMMHLRDSHEMYNKNQNGIKQVLKMFGAMCTRFNRGPHPTANVIDTRRFVGKIDAVPQLCCMPACCALCGRLVM